MRSGLLTDHDVYLFREGTHVKLAEKLGAQLRSVDGIEGVEFAVWAPNARQVSVTGDFNGWDRGANPLRAREDGSGIWEGFVPAVDHGARYKYHIASRFNDYRVDKADPFAFYAETPPATASRVWSIEHPWTDDAWMQSRRAANALDAPLSVYEMHVGSWRRVPEESNRPFTYREIAQPLTEHVTKLGFTHVEFLPLTEHPFYGSWGYQTTGYFAPTARYGTPQDLMYLINYLHVNGVGVILDWVPSHFPGDEHGLAYFDGTHLFEHADARKGFHPDWNSYVFNYGRHEVRSFLMSSAIFWLDRYHVDGIRVDAVASMLYLDYGRKHGEWIPNEHGGRENLEAILLLRQLNEAVYREHPDVQTIAEESTAWPMVSRPTYLGGLGFGLKWNMGWMHDTLQYFSRPPVFRKYHQDQLTFSIWYGFTENFMLPLSHDEVVHGKGTLIGRMPGDNWQQFANLRLLFGYMWAHPGKKLLFMGGEFGQRREWQHEESLEWHVLEFADHAGAQRWVQDLNAAYRTEAALHELDCSAEGFEWIDTNDRENSTLSFIRKSRHGREIVLVVCNFTPVPRTNHMLGVPRDGVWLEILNSDSSVYGGGGAGNFGGIEAAPISTHGREHSITATLPPLSILMFKSAGAV